MPIFKSIKIYFVWFKVTNYKYLHTLPFYNIDCTLSEEKNDYWFQHENLT